MSTKAKQLEKAKVSVELPFQIFLEKFFCIYDESAIVLSKLLGLYEEPSATDEYESWEERQKKRIEEKLAQFTLIKAAHDTEDYSKLGELTPSTMAVITKAVEDYDDMQKELKQGFVSKAVGWIEKHFGGTKEAEDNKSTKPLIALPIMKSVNELERIVTYVLYEHTKPDAHGNWAKPSALEKGCHDFNVALEAGKIVPNLFHDKADGKYASTDTFKILKSYICPDDCYYGDDKEPVAAGTWLIKVQYENDKLWEYFLDGTIQGVSLGCLGTYKQDV